MEEAAAAGLAVQPSLRAVALLAAQRTSETSSRRKSVRSAWLGLGLRRGLTCTLPAVPAAAAPAPQSALDAHLSPPSLPDPPLLFRFPRRSVAIEDAATDHLVNFSSARARTSSGSALHLHQIAVQQRPKSFSSMSPFASAGAGGGGRGGGPGCSIRRKSAVYLGDQEGEQVKTSRT
jgi:hypothetical protein